MKIDAETIAQYQLVVVIPAYKVENQIAETITRVPSYIRHIIVVNDASPDHTKAIVTKLAKGDTRILLISHEKNQGVGGAMLTGFQKALELDAQIVIKIDGDGQMSDYDLLPLLTPLIEGKADFTKGNRFRDFHALQAMPLVRQIGNMGLSFLVKAATGYWDIFDPTNGFIAMRHETLKSLNLERLHKRYFFETSLLGELYLADAVIKDIPYPANYGDEVSNLSVTRTLFEFPPKLWTLLMRRILIKKFLYNFGIDSLYLLSGVPMLIFSLVFGIIKWIKYSQLGLPAPTGTVMIPVIFLILGFQLILSAVNIDFSATPKEPVAEGALLEEGF
jgi:dolichol-phosphate mannosyltransferase